MLETLAATVGGANQRVDELVTELRRADVDRADGNQRNEWLSELRQIAQQHLQIETFEERGGESLDVHEIGVTSLRAALTAAYHTGIGDGIRHVVNPIQTQTGEATHLAEHAPVASSHATPLLIPQLERAPREQNG